MSLEKSIVICCINHVAWSNDHIWLMHTFDHFDVFQIACDICVINIIFRAVLCKKNLQSAFFGVDVIMTAGSQMFYQRTGLDVYKRQEPESRGTSELCG